MRKQAAVVAALILAFAGAGSSAIVTGALAQSKPLTAIQQAKRLGPKPTPRWYWRWTQWQLGLGYAKGHRLEQSLRPKQAPRRIPTWAWQRLHYFMLARAQRELAANGKKGRPPGKTTTTSTTTTGTTSTTTTATTTTTTTPTTTTATTTTTPTPSGDGTYDQAISYTQTPPAFSASREVDVSSATQFSNALADLQAGDLVKATADFTVNGETVINKRLPAPAVIDLTGHTVKFVYSGGQNTPAVWLNNPQNIRIYGGELTTDHTGGACLISYGGQDNTWWNFTAHDCGGNGASIFTITAAAEHNDFQGTIWNVGQNLAWDPHTEKGSGLHCANLDDHGNYPFQNNRIALYCHDIPVGAAIEYGDSITTYPPTNNTIYLKAVNLTFVSQTQTGGNAIQFWGVNGQSADIKYLEVQNAQGYGLFDGGMYSGTTLTNVTVEQGTATNTNQNPRYSGQNPWRTNTGVVYKSVRPAR